ncbi:hypothetical protein SeMB42_g02413 [Synchytrium endobioticum]|uniref:Coronin n=1 Tax=Synchytrium endobioticum TaxID=286115 RepID=A0A507DFD3_9FUNG|nr:hypothetical protein SeLEV6574_g07274 [Synchytrium endobioticum]TPX49957.1 hypothetical protein SeMB42_g02413 [Synchytrium endobioticum]
MSRFVRASKYRHVFGTASKRDQCYDNIKVSRSAWDTNLVKANQYFISINLEASGGGAFAVISQSNTGKIGDSLAVYNGHSAAVLDTDFHPFNDHVIASCSEDCKVMIWTIPKGGPTTNINTPVLSLNSHGRKVGHVLFHPTAENVLASASADFTIKLWDISTGQEKVELAGHADIINSLTWNWNGNLLATTCKDKKVRIFDARSSKVVSESMGHTGVKGSRVTWCGSTDKIITTGFSKTSDRQVFIWDTKKLDDAVKQESIGTSSGMLMPFYDEGTSMLYLAGKGDGNIRYYEYVDDENGLYPLAEYKSSEPARGIGFVPKRSCDVSSVEVARAYKVHPSLIEPISFRVPRKSDAFQSDLFPDCPGPDPALSADEYFAGQTKGPILISLEGGFVAPVAPKDFTTSAISLSDSAPPKAPSTEKEYQDAYHSLRKECDDLKNVVAQRDAKIRQLEAQLAAIQTK